MQNDPHAKAAKAAKSGLVLSSSGLLGHRSVTGFKGGEREFPGVLGALRVRLCWRGCIVPWGGGYVKEK